MFDCEIFVAGGSSCGRPGKDARGPAHDFFKNYTTFYTAIKNHVLTCPRCEPDEAMRRWLAMRDERNGGLTSDGLLKTVLQMERACRRKKIKDRGKTVDPVLVNQFAIRSGTVSCVQEREALLTEAELVESVRWMWKEWTKDRDEWMARTGPPHGSGYGVTPLIQVRRVPGSIAGAMAGVAAFAFDLGQPFPDEGELVRLATVETVMLG
jgi:hypothetical protein